MNILRVNGKTAAASREEKGFAYLKGSWEQETEIEIEFDMKARLIRANRKIHYNGGRAAIVRGPLAYCLEEADNGRYLDLIAVKGKAELTESWDEGMPGGSVTVTAQGVRDIAGTEEALYEPYEWREEEVEVKAVPYFLWNNRKPGEMQVWMRVK